MDFTKINLTLAEMKNQEMPQLIVSDAVVIYYLTGLRIWPGERLLALYLNVDGTKKLLVNDLSRQPEDTGLDIAYYNDIDDSVLILSQWIDASQVIGIDKNWPSRFLLRLQEIYPDGTYVNSSTVVDLVRRIKTPEEQEKMRISSKINDEVMEKLVAIVQEKHTELELNKIVRQLYSEAGCEDVAFDPITSFGVNAADPHHDSDETVGKAGDCLVMDIGGLKDDYCSDMTRTIFMDHVSDRHKEIYNIVLEANLRGIAAAKPGNRMCDVDHAARGYIEEMGFGKYFTHRTGHSIGMEDHEPGDANAINTDIIRPGQIFSVEPGIYIPEENIGVRIEDLVLITEDGCEVLNHFPKELMVLPMK